MVWQVKKLSQQEGPEDSDYKSQIIRKHPETVWDAQEAFENYF